MRAYSRGVQTGRAPYFFVYFVGGKILPAMLYQKEKNIKFRRRENNGHIFIFYSPCIGINGKQPERGYRVRFGQQPQGDMRFQQAH